MSMPAMWRWAVSGEKWNSFGVCHRHAAIDFFFWFSTI